MSTPDSPLVTDSPEKDGLDLDALAEQLRIDEENEREEARLYVVNGMPNRAEQHERDADEYARWNAALTRLRSEIAALRGEDEPALLRRASESPYLKANYPDLAMDLDTFACEIEDARESRALNDGENGGG